jgi:hypothetical protein
MNKHTPGPWQAHSHQWSLCVVGNIDGPLDNGEMHYTPVCDVSDIPDAADANMRLICAAPELLALLQEAYASPLRTEGSDWWTRVIAAIKKATGAA